MIELLETRGDQVELATSMPGIDTVRNAGSSGQHCLERRNLQTSNETHEIVERQLIEMRPGIVENWLALIKIASNGLIGTTIVLAVLALITFMASFLRSLVLSY
jgi:hypothetical protein